MPALHALVSTQLSLTSQFGTPSSWNGAAVKPTNMHIIGDDALKGEGLEEERGLMVLGVPVGHHALKMACPQ